MPNHTTNILTCTSGKNIFDVIKPYLSDKEVDGEHYLDLNKIIPVPDCLSYDSTQSKEDNIKECGYADEYNWRVDNWGTKWNTYDASPCPENKSFGFSTEWSPPIPCIKMLSVLTGESFELAYLNEGYMCIGLSTLSPDGDINEYYDDVEDAPESLIERLGLDEDEEFIERLGPYEDGELIEQREQREQD